MVRPVAIKDVPAERFMVAIKPKCFTIPEFCASHRIGVTMYYQLRKEGRAPNEFRVGDKWLITKEAAKKWRAAREAEAQKDA
jgi:hypothetical protein